ncbi:hypothetical protein EWM64_g876 [Hericium alpestre]|uniref:GDP-Man:Man(3)GlcNAc(2)-PP-Dol alpha-1,2-mannosyltransferase n=1 Tax=Hericium alpestre TaxID=135208 RepID=A0A4Z0A7S3_9AGAM|nr:hypothetical protein EWM64_g876 [Hericium alpestre]
MSPSTAPPVVPAIIDNKSFSSQDSTFTVQNPRTHAAASLCTSVSLETITHAIERANAAYPAWEATPLWARRDVLLRAADIMATTEWKEKVLQAMREETNSSPAWAAHNVVNAANNVRNVASMVNELKGETFPSNFPGGQAFVQRRALGVIYSVCAWNGPVPLTIRGVAIPLICGNAVLCRPSEYSPRVQLHVFMAFVEAGIPPGVIAYLPMSRSDTPALTPHIIGHPYVRKITFTGSDRVGTVINTLAAQHLKPCLLELGGKAPVVVFEDAPAAAVRVIISSSLLNAGQICMSTERVIVLGKGKLASLIAEIRQILHAAFAPGTESGLHWLGSLVGENDAPAERVRGLVRNAVDAGAEVVWPEAGYDAWVARMQGEDGVVAPCVVSGVKPGMDLWDRESFGPVVGLTVAESTEEALQLANATTYSLTAGVWTRDVYSAMGFARGLRTVHAMIYTPAFLIICLIAYVRNLRDGNKDKRNAIFKALGIPETETDKKKIVGFFHPYCNAGGGGERVLWTAIVLTQRAEPDVVSVVYSGDKGVTKEQIIEKVKANFDIALAPESLHFVFLQSRNWIEDSAWPHFTLAGQSIGSMYLAFEALCELIPDLYIDTMGYAFTFYVVAWLTGVPIGAYMHYPTISTSMLKRVENRTASYMNSGAISSSSILSSGKLLYYRIFMYYYAQALRHASFVMVNSSWTKNHVDSILTHSDVLLDVLHLPFTILTFIASLALSVLLPKVSHNSLPRTAPKKASIVYPSCDTRAMSAFPLEGRERIILSIAQFRPEKDHAAQLRSLHALFRKYGEYKAAGVKLVLVGGSRNEEDAKRVEGLRNLAKELEIEDYVEFAINAPYSQMLSYLSRASIGLSTMVDEHFGINVVEFMAAGLIPISHASGGPLNDIIVPYDGQPTGFHAKDPDSFAEALHTALTLSTEEDLAVRQRARSWAVSKFSESEFGKGWQASGWRQWL